MKLKSILLTIILASTAAAASYGQGFHIGAKGGVNINQVQGRSFNDQFQYAYAFGGFVEIGISKKWGIQPELLWSQSKTTTSSNINDIYIDGLIGQNITLNYISVPLLVTYRLLPVLTLQAGPQFGILVDQTTHFVYSVENAFSKGDISALAGAQVNLGGFRVGARYFIGLNNINGTSMKSADTWKNKGFQLYIGLRII